MAWLVILLLLLLLHRDARSLNWCLAPFLSYHLIPRGRKTIRILQQTLLLPTAGIEPGPPTQQASALSITPLPLGLIMKGRKGLDPFLKWADITKLRVDKKVCFAPSCCTANLNCKVAPLWRPCLKDTILRGLKEKKLFLTERHVLYN